MNVFETLNKVDVSKFTEQKGQFTYLSWADAVNELLSYYPEATWEVKHNPDGWPYFPCPAGAFVEVSLTIEGITRTQVHPVLDYKNKPISEPDSFQVNTAIQRCLAKAISLHGLGLYIYRGEDLPDTQFRFKPGEKDEIIKQVKDALFNGDGLALKQILDEYHEPESKMAVWALFTSRERDSIKKMLDDNAAAA
jgi:hypothetical protein